MMGVTTEELKEVIEPVKENRVLGFAEEEERRRARRQPATQADAKSRLPKGPYTFREFRVLDLPLNPPPAKAFDLLYKLASDRGIERIMNEHKWQVGILSELAPKGYVGLSPKCLLGQNMNRGQDISLRLRTYDLQGFRKYGNIKKTLLRELAHMVHDEHDEHFHALDKQKGITEPDPDESTSGPSVHASLPVLKDREPDPDDSQDKTDLLGSNTSRGIQEPDPDDMLTLSDWIKTAQRCKPTIVDAEDESMSVREERNPDESTQREPDPDESSHRDEPDPDESLRREEPDPDESTDSEESVNYEPGAHGSVKYEPGVHGSVKYEPGVHGSVKYENVLDLNVEQLNEELIIILEAASAAATRLQQAVVHIMQQATPAETSTAINTLSTIMSNLINNPNEVKYKTIRKMNHRFQDQIGRFEGAVQFLREVGFSEETSDGSDCFVLKTSDPDLLWLALDFLRFCVINSFPLILCNPWPFSLSLTLQRRGCSILIIWNWF